MKNMQSRFIVYTTQASYAIIAQLLSMGCKVLLPQLARLSAVSKGTKVIFHQNMLTFKSTAKYGINLSNANVSLAHMLPLQLSLSVVAFVQLLAWEPSRSSEVTVVTVRPNFQDSVHVGYVAGLKKFTEYYTSVLCFTTPGDGPRSVPQRIRTHEDSTYSQRGVLSTQSLCQAASSSLVCGFF